MAEHTLSFGINIIDNIANLGKILDYHCEKESTISEESGSAVDVGWFIEPEQINPLFIFEVESKTTNSIFSNPSKVYGVSNQKFEKPLFFFHILLKGGEESEKIQQLQTLFGTHNYRVYRFSLKDDQSLIIDILTQHRRISSSLNIIAFINELTNNWEYIDFHNVLNTIENLKFENLKRTLLYSYAILTRSDDRFKSHFIRKLKSKYETPKSFVENENYETYLGRYWQIPIHLGLLSAFNEEGLEEKYFQDFVYWQEKSSYMKMIGPYFGLDRDYDLFIFGISGAVLGLTATLFYKVKGAREYLANELFQILEKTKDNRLEINLGNALWLMHISPNNKNGKKYYEFAQNILNENGGVPELILDEIPTNFASIVQGEAKLEQFGEKVILPDWADFQNYKLKLEIKPEVIFKIAINYLIDDEDDNWNPITSGQLK